MESHLWLMFEQSTDLMINSLMVLITVNLRTYFLKPL